VGFFPAAPYVYRDRTYDDVRTLRITGLAAGIIALRFLAVCDTTDHIDAGEVGPVLVQVERTFFAMDDAQISADHVFMEDRLVSWGSPGRATETGPAPPPDRRIRNCEPQRGRLSDA
jgi:hypothetical protein